ncbi:MAG TPA: hypothetical protein PLU22_17060, partial [Polyangiaceae bacterium]|nr:hypothetical protein [Polyangiaceae bacterium]
GRDGTNLDMAIIREHLAHKGLGLHNDLQDESSIVGNFPQVIMMDRFGTELSAPVAAAVPVAASAVLGALGLAAAGERAGKPAGEPPLP